MKPWTRIKGRLYQFIFRLSFSMAIRCSALAYLGPGSVAFHSRACWWGRSTSSFWWRKIAGRVLIWLHGSVQPLFWMKLLSMALLWNVPFGDMSMLALVPGLHTTLLISGYSMLLSPAPSCSCSHIQMKPINTRNAQYITIVLVPTSPFVFSAFGSFMLAAFCPSRRNVPDQFSSGTVTRHAVLRIA